MLEKNKLSKDKTIQIAAGYSHSLIMNENRDIFWFGTSGRLNRQATPVPLMLSEVLPSLVPDTSGVLYQMGQQIDYAVVKINTSWSKSLSITNFMIADLRAINQDQPFNKIYQLLKTLSLNWDQRESK